MTKWPIAQLGDIATIQSGGTPSRSVREYWDGDIPWIKISDLTSTYVTASEERITTPGLQNSSAKVFPKGTILLTIFATIGKVAILDIAAATNQAIAGITPRSNSYGKFLYYALVHYSNDLLVQGKGVAQKNINCRFCSMLTHHSVLC
jgi:type I restriction enzyme S subunit